MKSQFVANLLHGVKDPQKQSIQREIDRLTTQADTLGEYARAAARTYALTGRESALGAETRFSTKQHALKARIAELERSLGSLY